MFQDCLNPILEHSRVKNEMTAGGASTFPIHEFSDTAFMLIWFQY